MLPKWLSWTVICATMVFGFPLATGMETINDNLVTCSNSDADVVFLIDTTSSNSTAFLVQQHRLLRTLKRLSIVLKGRSVRYGVIGFHRTPELMLELQSPFANDSQRVADLISALRPRQSTSTSVARALDEAMSLFFESRTGTDRRQIIILAHDGVNTDLVAETLEAVSNVEKLGAVVFAVTGNTRANAFALLGYAGSRDRLFVSAADRAIFQDSLDETLGVCESITSAVTTTSKNLRRRVHGVRGRRAKAEKNVFVPGQKCGFDKVDLTLVLDTSGSVFRVFEDQREIALNILDEIPVEAYSDAVQVSVTRFAAGADVILPFLKGRGASEIKDAIKEVKFTGQNTRIAGAVEIALDEMERARRRDARQIFVLISDGHGQEYWNVVQATGKRLQETKAELFAVSASQDYNEAELLIYIGDGSRVFVGPKYNGFLSALSSYVKDCISKGEKSSAAVLSGRNSLDFSTIEETPFVEKETSTIGGSITEKDFSTTEETPFVEKETSTIGASITEEVRETTEEDSPEDGTTIATVSLIEESSTPTNTEFSSNNDESRTVNESNNDESTTVDDSFFSTTETSIESISGEGEDGNRFSNELETGTESSEGSAERRSRLRDISLGSSSCEVDLILIIDRSESVEGDFKKEIELAVRSLELFPAGEFASGRVRVGAVSFAKDAKLELALGRYQRKEIAKALEGIVHTGGTTSSVEGARLAMQQVMSTRRPKARLITLLFTDGHSQDYWRELIETSMRIRDIPNSVLLAITASKEFSQSELQVWAGESSKVFVSSEQIKFLDAVNEEIKKCGKPQVEGKIGEVESIVEKIGTGNRSPVETSTESSGEESSSEALEEDGLAGSTSATVEDFVDSSTTAESTLAVLEAMEAETTIRPQIIVSAEQFSVTSRILQIDSPETSTTFTDSVVETASSDSDAEASGSEEDGSGIDDVDERRAHGIRTISDVLKISEEKGRTSLFASVPCSTDLMFVVDTSTSVEAEFHQQLQLAVDLVKRLPADDFEHRIRVGVVVFNAKARVALSMGESRSRSALLDSLLNLRYSGGSTSVASGVNTALDEIELYRRNDARLMVVLLSDGNSQDHWDDVIRSSNRLRTTGAEVYAVTISKNYMFRELELYAGDKMRVYIDARVRQFLDETENGVTHCGRSSEPASPVVLQAPKSCSSLVDVLILLDISTPPASFYQEKQLAIDLLKALPASVFERRLAVSIITFATNSTIVLPLGVMPKDEIVFELERVANGTGPASLTRATASTIAEIKSQRRKGSRVLVIIVSNGNGGEEKWRNVQRSSASLRASGAEVYAVALTETANFEKLKAYTGTESNLYLAEKSDRFIQEIGNSILSCGPSADGVNNVESDDAIAQAGTLVKFTSDTRKRRCAYDRMDLQIILDASSSRQEVFEHQRELALSLIERLPISADGTDVAVGIVSFTATPIIRLPLGLGRDKAAIRSTIESIEYRGGSTLTAQAVDLSIDDLLRGRRPDAIQVVVLMNDGFSQDEWDRVLSSSGRLASTKSELFGVALGNEVDLRELERYIGRDDRIYRDGSTEKFLNDVVSLLKGEKDCIETKVHRESTIPQQHSPSDECAKPGLDLVVIFDNTEKNVRKRDSSINSNRYLLLDVLGSLKSGARVRVSVVSFGGTPKITLDFTDISERDRIFAEIESIRAVRTQPSYAEAISLALAKIQNKDRADAQTALVILGNGNSKDTDSVRNTASSRIRQTPSVTCFAVDSSPSTNVSTLEQFTGSPDRVYPYERTAEFAKEVKRLVNSMENAKCKSGGLRGRVHAAAGVEVREAVYSTPEPLKSKAAVQRDALVESLNVDKINEGKFVLRKKIVTTAAAITTPTTTTTSSTPSTTTPSSTTTRRSTPSRRPTTLEPSSTTDILTTIQRRITTTQQSTTTQPSTTSSKRTRRPTSLIPPTEATTRTTTARTTTTTASTTSRALTSPSFPQYFPRKTTDEPEEPSTTFKPGCLLDLILVLDSSGSVEETFLREKELAAGIVSRLRVGPNNARVSIIKFAGTQQVKTVWSFANLQSRGKILRVLNGIPFTSGTTAIHSALLKALAEYTTDHGARPGHARPVAIIFTDGYAQKSTSEEAAMLRAVIPDTYAIAINHSYPISRTELEVIVGSPERVFTDSNIGKFHDILETIARDCIVD
ncbi:hypothetical protein V3C99_003170 [Haemonchus contortus]